MGVYIKGMEMPPEGRVLICISNTGLVTTYDGEVMDEAIAFEVPKHGRLIDADALSERIEEQRNTEYAMKNKPHGSWKRVLELSLDMISDAPTIIEEER